MLVSLIVPTLNEGGSIKRLFDKFKLVSNELAKEGRSLEVVVVDDGSTDNTVELVKNYGYQANFKIRLLRRSIRGLATAVIDGFKYAQGDILGVIDADLSHPPELIPILVNGARDFDLVVASRNVKGGGVEDWPAHRRALSRGATILTYFLGIRVKDPMSGYFFLKRKVLGGVILSPVGYKILLEILVKGKYQNAIEVPYIFRNRDVGESKAGAREGLNYICHLSKLYSWKLFSKK